MRTAVTTAALFLAAAFAAGPARADEPPTFAPEPVPGEIDGTIAGEVVVDLRDDLSDAEVAAIAHDHGVALRANSPRSDAHDRVELADVDPASEARLVDELARDPRVEHAEPLEVMRASFVPDDPLYASKQWHLARVGSQRAWDYTCGRGVTVAVIDTGIACFDDGPFTRGTDLAGTRCERGYDFVNDHDGAADDHGHGTHVAGTIAQTTNNGKGVAGLAFCADLLPVKVLSRQGWGTSADVAEGIRYATEQGAQVINLSLGGPWKSAVIEDAVKHAIAQGVVVVAAAGNSGGSVGYPAGYDDVLAVSATDANDRIAWFSSRGPEVDLAAPGVSVTQQTVCNGGKARCELFGTFSGTSMASPHVAGAAALLVAEGVTSPGAVRAALTSSARPAGDPKLYGAGILDAGQAVAHAYSTRLVWRLGALLACFLWVRGRIRRRGGTMGFGPSAVLGALFGATGVFPLAPWLVPHGLAAELLARPFGEWDSAWGARLHAWLPLAGALPVLALVGLFFGVRRFRPLLGGFALGTAALGAELAFAGDARFALGALLMRVYLVASVALCLWVARVALDRGKL